MIADQRGIVAQTLSASHVESGEAVMGHNTDKKVTVVIVNFNGLPHLDACIASLAGQTCQDFEIMLVDNASTDGSVEYVRRKYPDLLVHTNAQNLGYAGAINSALAHVTSDYVAPLNMDTVVGQDWLRPMLEVVSRDPSVGAVTPKILFHEHPDRICHLGLHIHVTGLGFAGELGERTDKYADGPMRVAGVSGCSFLMKKKLLEDIGGLNDEIFMYYEDVELSWLLNLMGYRLYCVPESVVYHKYELRMTPEKLFWLERSRLRLIARAFAWRTLLVMLPLLAFTECLVGAYCVIRGWSYVSAKARAFGSAFTDLRLLRDRRSQIQGLRKMSDFQLFRKLQLNYQWGQLLRILK